MKDWLLNKILGFAPQIGDRIHLHSVQGSYEIVDINKSTVQLTCNIWKRNSDKPVRTYPLKDLKCFHGDYLLYRKVNINANAVNRQLC